MTEQRNALSSLGLLEMPFRTSSDPKYFWLSPQHKAPLRRSLELITYQLGATVIEGAIGVGKTSWAKYLYGILVGSIKSPIPDLAGDYKSRFEVRFDHTGNYEGPRDAMRSWAGAFELPGRRAYDHQLKDFEDYLVDLREQNKSAVLIVDDAHLMSPKALQAVQALFNFDVDKKLLQVVLVGQTPDIRTVFATNKAVISRVQFWNSLGVFTFDEMVAALEYRVNQAGRNIPLLELPASEALYAYSQIARDAVTISNSALLLLMGSGRSLNERSSITKSMMEDGIEEYQNRPPVLEEEMEIANGR